MESSPPPFLPTNPHAQWTGLLNRSQLFTWILVFAVCCLRSCMRAAKTLKCFCMMRAARPLQGVGLASNSVSHTSLTSGMHWFCFSDVASCATVHCWPLVLRSCSASPCSIQHLPMFCPNPSLPCHSGIFSIEFLFVDLDPGIALRVPPPPPAPQQQADPLPHRLVSSTSTFVPGNAKSKQHWGFPISNPVRRCRCSPGTDPWWWCGRPPRAPGQPGAAA